MREGGNGLLFTCRTLRSAATYRTWAPLVSSLFYCSSCFIVIELCFSVFTMHDIVYTLLVSVSVCNPSLCMFVVYVFFNSNAN